MDEEKEKVTRSSKKKSGISRREFIAGTVGGVVVGAVAGAAAGSIGFPKTITQTETETATKTALETTTATQTQTATQTTTTTVVQAPPTLSFTVNGTPVTLDIGTAKPTQVAPYHTLAWTLRQNLGLTGTKIGCYKGACGACTVLSSGNAILSCKTLTVEMAGKNITTVEGLAQNGKLDPVQTAFVNDMAMQCGYCTAGFIMSAKALLNQNKNPTLDQVKQGLSGNICRCGSQTHIYQAVLDAATGGS